MLLIQSIPSACVIRKINGVGHRANQTAKATANAVFFFDGSLPVFAESDGLVSAVTAGDIAASTVDAEFLVHIGFQLLFPAQALG
ncbi:hypothetical protein SDC9_198515 [bioreactor metagenome]|uniref:Uncharacterized protein n=1 Tax=bioreactor metagenome TaxID=1076179 RepID=A0A645IHW8_9ZZZZ